MLSTPLLTYLIQCRIIPESGAVYITTSCALAYLDGGNSTEREPCSTFAFLLLLCSNGDGNGA